MKKGFMYLVAIIDVYSRFIVGWSLHNSLDASHCIEVLQNAIATYGSPEIINSDQGCQFTCKAWLDACAQHPQMRVSMDGRGRAKDNIWIERFWKTTKYEYIYILPKENGAEHPLHQNSKKRDYAHQNIYTFIGSSIDDMRLQRIGTDTRQS